MGECLTGTKPITLFLFLLSQMGLPTLGPNSLENKNKVRILLRLISRFMLKIASKSGVSAENGRVGGIL